MGINTHPTKLLQAWGGDPLGPLSTHLVPSVGGEGEVESVILQKESARQLINLFNTPVQVVTGEASYHARFDRSTVSFLHQAGVNAEWLRLGDIGIHANGLMLFVEKNSDEIAEALERWMQTAIL